MKKFPTEKAPREYDQDVFTRAMEDIYDSIGKSELGSGAGLEFLHKKVKGLEGRLSGVEGDKRQDQMGSSTVMPEPTNVAVVRLLPGIFFISCDQINRFKYPHVRGFQFFGSTEPDFELRIESAKVTYTGTNDTVAAGNVFSDTASLTENTDAPGFYTDLPFWSDMDLQTDGVNVTNTTKDESGSITVWSKTAPWQMTCALSGGAQWELNDAYSMDVWRPRNLVGQGAFSFALGGTPLLWWFNNPKWDGRTYYVKVRTFGKNKYSNFVCASTTAADEELDAPTIDAVPCLYRNHIALSYEITGMGPWETWEKISSWKIYRRTDTTTPTESDIIATTQFKFYKDWAYDADSSPDGPAYDTQYYYWVKAVNKENEDGALSNRDGAKLGLPATPSIYNGEADGDGWGNLQNWKVQWTCAGDCEGFWVQKKVVGQGYTPRVYVPFTEDYGLHLGEHIQEHTFPFLYVGKTYTFQVIPTNNMWVPAQEGTADTQNYTIESGSTPDAPA